MATYKLGKDCEPSVGGVNDVTDVTLTIGGDEVKVTKRGDPDHLYQTGINDIEFTVKANFAIGATMPVRGTKVGVTAGGITKYCVVSNVERGEPLDNKVELTIKLKPTPQ